MKIKELLLPQYMQNFQCTGNKCEDSCCYGWQVNIDENTYKKYKKITDYSLKQLINKNVTKNSTNPSYENYATIKMDHNGCCPFWEDKLCRLHKELGGDFLSRVCMTYPRKTNVVNDVFEKSVTVSCPEAARLVLLNQKLMEFDQVEEPTNEQNIVSHNIKTDSIQNDNNVKRYFWPLRIFSISLLQNRKYTLSNRLITLGLFMKEVKKYIDNGKVHELPKLIEGYDELIKNESLIESLNDISSNLTLQMELIKEFNDQRFSLLFNQNSNSYIECVVECLQGIGYTDDARVEEIGERYKEAYLNYYEPFMKNHEYILENYLVNYVFKEMFPIVSEDGVFEDYVKMVINFSLIKMLLIGMSSYHKKLNEELIIRLVYSFSRAIEHNLLFYNDILKLLKENGYNNMAYMTILLKD